MLNVKLKGENRWETVENYSIAGIVGGALLLTLGIALTTISPKGASAIMSMMGALISFLSSVSLVATWVLKEFFGK